MRRAGPLPWLKPGVFVGALVPLAAILFRAWRGALGANPIAQALNQLGLIALVFLVAALACTPLKPFFGWTWPISHPVTGIIAIVTRPPGDSTSPARYAV